jgi:homoserine/homoserine lactone efflux protein
MALDMWIGYVLAMLVISISPGSGCINTLSTSLSYGFRLATAAIAGLQVGLLIQLTIVGVGLGAIFATSPTAFLCCSGQVFCIWSGLVHPN